MEFKKKQKTLLKLIESCRVEGSINKYKLTEVLLQKYKLRKRIK